jgi:hypothetical protein
LREAIENLSVQSPAVAARFVLACQLGSRAFTDALEDVRGKISDADFSALVGAVGTVLGHEILDLRNQLVRQHPQLDMPDVEQLIREFKGGRHA